MFNKCVTIIILVGAAISASSTDIVEATATNIINIDISKSSFLYLFKWINFALSYRPISDAQKVTLGPLSKFSFFTDYFGRVERKEIDLFASYLVVGDERRHAVPLKVSSSDDSFTIDPLTIKECKSDQKFTATFTNLLLQEKGFILSFSVECTLANPTKPTSEEYLQSRTEDSIKLLQSDLDTISNQIITCKRYYEEIDYVVSNYRKMESYYSKTEREKRDERLRQLREFKEEQIAILKQSILESVARLQYETNRLIESLSPAKIVNGEVYIKQLEQIKTRADQISQSLDNINGNNSDKEPANELLDKHIESDSLQKTPQLIV